MKLIREEIEKVEVITEEKNGKKTLYNAKTGSHMQQWKKCVLIDIHSIVHIVDIKET